MEGISDLRFRDLRRVRRLSGSFRGERGEDQERKGQGDKV